VRNKSTKVLKAMAEKGGLLGFSLYPLHLKGGADCTLTEFCQMVANTADMMGVDNLGIGSDMCRQWGYDVLEWMRSGTWTLGVNYGEGVVGKKSWPPLPAWFSTPAHMPNLTEGLLKQGFSEVEVGKIMGGNWLRFMEDGFMPR
jgi:microsomal dipeptidase-like Zn-dependent dipeptidase